jgi:parallel beta-helix repeat protein
MNFSYRFHELLLCVGMLAMVGINSRALATDYYVSPSGLDTNPGTSTGSAFATIQKGIATATAGSNVYIMAGTYRQQVEVTTGSGGSAGNPIVVQPYNGGMVVIKGSDVVTGWQLHSGSIWKKTGFTSRPQQVFVDFSETNMVPPLRQVGNPNPSFYTAGHTYDEYPNPLGAGLADMVENSFYWDSSSNTLYVWLPGGADPSSHTMEVSVRRRLFFTSKPYITLKNLNFRHTAGSSFAEQEVAVQLNSGCIADNCDIQWCDFAGLSMGFAQVLPAVGAQAVNCNVSNNGDLGISAPGSLNFLVQNCSFNSNNYRGFSGLWNAGGFKGAADAYGIIQDCEVAYNNGTGIWFDFADSGNLVTIRDNYIHDNGPIDAGIMYEGSNNGLIYNNLIVDNERRGIYISASDNTKVFNNTIVRQKTRAAIEVDGMPRAGKTLKNNLIYNNIIYGNTATNATYDLFIRKNEGTDIVGNVTDNNCFYRSTGAIQLTLRSNAATTTYTTLSAWRTASGYDLSSISANPLFQVGTGTNYVLSSTSPAKDIALTRAEVTDDYMGTSRPQGSGPDIGAFETATTVGGGTVGLAGYWRLNENTGTTTADASTSGNTGQILSATWTGAGIAGTPALQFNGTSAYVNCGNGASLSLTTAVTLAGWFKHSATGGGGYSGVDKPGSYRLVAIEAGAAASHWQFFLTDPAGAAHFVQSPATYSNDAWHHVTGTFNGSQLALYIDGTLVATGAWTGSIKTTTNVLQIGRREGTSYFSGTMDSIKVYTRALTSQEVSGEFSQPN